MKNNLLGHMPRYRRLMYSAFALLVGATTLNAPGAHAQGVQQLAVQTQAQTQVPVQVQVQALAPISEALEVNASLFKAQSFDWFDSQRQRPVPAKLYLPTTPAAPASMPLVVFSHGIGGSRDGYSYLGRYFAAHGYASLHVQHVGSDRQLWRGNPLSLVSRLSDAAQDSEALNRVQDPKTAGEPLGRKRGVVPEPSYFAFCSPMVIVASPGSECQTRQYCTALRAQNSELKFGPYG